MIFLAVYSLPGLAQTVPSGYMRIAAEHHVPPTFLYAIALTESGLTIRQGRFRPWPWTLNVQGKPYRFATKRAAWKALQQHLKNGIRSIDIGLMQVNWRYHQKKLGSPWRALDPYHNIQVGAAILTSAYRETRNWQHAIGRYHSPGKSIKQKRRAIHYRQLVMEKVKTLQVAS